MSIILHSEDDIGSVYKDSEFDLDKITFVQAVNHSKRKDIIRGIILHHIMMGEFQKNVDFLASKESNVSAHYVLGVEGSLTQLVALDRKAWHSGISKYVLGGQMRNDLNHCTIGIEIVNPGRMTKKGDKYTYLCNGAYIEWKGEDTPVKNQITYPDGSIISGYGISYPVKQIDMLVALCKAIVKKYPNITRNDIAGHFQVSLPYGTKNDPFNLDIEYIKTKIFG